MSNGTERANRFAGYVRLSTLDRPFVSRAQERALLTEGVSRFDLSAEDARGVLLTVAQTDDLRVERDIDARILPVLHQFGGKRRKISRRRFKQAAEIYRGMAGGLLSEEEARIRVKRVMQAQGFRPKRAGIFMSRRWYRKIDRRTRGSQGGLMPVLSDGSRDA